MTTNTAGKLTFGLMGMGERECRKEFSLKLC